MSDSATKRRKQYRNLGLGDLLFGIKQPPAAIASILHRISGALLFLALPVILVPLFGQSVESPATFEAMKEWVGHPLCKLVLLVLMWGYFHHFFAGIRYITLDMHIGNDRIPSQRSGLLVIVLGLIMTVIFGLKLFGAW